MSDGKARVYVIVSPDVRRSKAWPKLRTVLRAKGENATLVVFEDLFPDGSADYAENWPTRSAELAGALVVACRVRGELWLGRRAVAEAQHMADLGKPVLVLGPDGLLPWPHVAARLDWPTGHPPFLAARVVLASAQSGPVIGGDGGRRAAARENLDPVHEPADHREHVLAPVV